MKKLFILLALLSISIVGCNEDELYTKPKEEVQTKTVKVDKPIEIEEEPIKVIASTRVKPTEYLELLKEPTKEDPMVAKLDVLDKAIIGGISSHRYIDLDEDTVLVVYQFDKFTCVYNKGNLIMYCEPVGDITLMGAVQIAPRMFKNSRYYYYQDLEGEFPIEISIETSIVDDDREAIKILFDALAIISTSKEELYVWDLLADYSFNGLAPKYGARPDEVILGLAKSAIRVGTKTINLCPLVDVNRIENIGDLYAGTILGKKVFINNTAFYMEMEKDNNYMYLQADNCEFDQIKIIMESMFEVIN